MEFPSGYMKPKDQEEGWQQYKDTALPGDKPQPVPGAVIPDDGGGTLVAPRTRDVGYSPPASNDPLDARYMALLRGRSQADSVQTAAAAGKATDLNPDASAKIIRLATDTGLPRDTVERRTKDVEGQQRQLEERYFNQLTHPVIKEYLKDPYNAAVTKDDPTFDLIDKMLNSIARSYQGTRQSGSVVSALSNQRALSTLDLIDQAEATGQIDTIKDDKDPLGFRFMTPDQRASYRSSLQNAHAQNLVDFETRNKIIKAIPGVDPVVAGALAAKNASEFWTYFSQKPVEFIATVGAESAVPSALIGATAYLSGGSVPIAAAMAGASSYGIDYGSSVVEALRNEGVNLEDRGAVEKALQDKNLMKRVTQYAHAHAAPVALLDAVAGGRAGGVRSLKGVALNTLEQGALGAAGEAAGQVATGKKELDFGEIAAEFFGEMVTAPVEASGALAATWRQHLQAKESQSFFAALGKTAEASKLRERLPEHLQDLVSKITADGPIENVYIEPRAFVQYFQSKNISPAVAAQQIFGDDAPLKQALAQGHDLEIPLGAYVANLAGTEHNAPLSMDLKFNPSDLSVRETESLMQDAKNAAQIEANKAKDKVGEESVSSIVSKGLQEAGYEKQTADLLAKQMDSFFEAQAARTGRKSGMELFKEYALRILGKGQQAKAGGQEMVQEQPAYHGSRHIFERFDMSKIGTGQGAQVHGWGLYFAKQKATADINYRRKYGGLKIEGVSDLLASTLIDEHITWVNAFKKARSDQQRLELLVEKDRHLRERRRAVIQRRVNAEKLQAAEGFDNNEYLNIKALKEEEMQYDQVINEFQQVIDRKGKDFKIGYGGRLYEVDIKAEDSEMLDLEASLDDQRAGFDRQKIADQIKEVQDQITADLLDRVKEYQDSVYDQWGYTGKEAERKVQAFEDNLAATTHDIDPKRLTDRYNNSEEPLTSKQVTIVKLAAELGTKVFGSKQEKDEALQRLGQEFRKTYEGFGLKLKEAEDQDIERAAEDFYMNLTNYEDDELESQYNQRVVDERGAIIRWINDWSSRWEDAANAKIQPAGYENTPIAKLLSNPVVKKVLDEYVPGYESDQPDTGRTLYKALVAAAKDGMNEIYAALGQETPVMHNPFYVKVEQFKHNRRIWWHLTYWDEQDKLLWAGDVKPEQAAANMSEEDFDLIQNTIDEVDVPENGRESDTVVIPWIGDPLPEINNKVNKFNSPEEVASKFLLSQGIKGLNYVGGQDGPAMVVFDDSLIDIKSYEQKTEDGARGRMIKYGNYEYDIQLLETADLSTFLHESGHLYLEILWNLATEKDASPQVRKDFNTILQWLGAEPGKPLVYEQHEQFARGIEAYFMEGKAPSADLQGAFARFRAWLMVIYKKLTSLNVRLNDDVRQVMDRMFATEDAIDAAQKENVIIPVFTTPEEAGMSPDEFDRYLKTVQTANIRAREEIQTRLMREWKREQTAWWDAQRAIVREEVRTEAVKDPGVVAYTTLRFGKDVNGNELPEEQQIKLDREALIALYGEDNPVLEQLRKYNLYRKTGGIAPDAAADLLGFKSGDELVRAALASVNWKQKVEEQTDTLMKERYGDMLIDGTMADQATEAMNNYERSKILHAELKALVKKRNEVEPFVQAERNRVRDERSRGLDTVRGVPSLDIFQRMAKQQIGLMPLRSITPNKFLVAARRASVEAVDNATKGKYALAARAKQQELYNLELYREARNAQRDVEKMLDFAKKMGMPQVRRRVGMAGGDFLDQIDAILERFDFKEVSALTAEKRLRLSEWVAQKERQGMTVDLPDYVVDEANRKPYRSLTLDEFKGVYDSLKHIDHLARLKNKLLKSKDKRELQVILAEIESTIRDNARKNDKSKLGKRLPQDETLRFIDSYFASHRKLASIIREMDGFKDGGPLWSAIMRPLNDAANSEATMIHEAGQKLKALFAPYATTQEQLKSAVTTATAGKAEYGMYKRERIPEINDSMSKMERLMVALNLGNEDSRAKIKAGYGWSDAQLEAILRPLTKEDWDFVQGMWDFVDSYWPQIEAKEKRVKGIAPERVEPSPVNTPYGTYKGGYFPLKYEDRSPGGQRAYGDRAREAAEMMMRGAYTQATTKRGHTKERVEGVRMPVRLDFGVIYEHVHQVVHDLTHHEALIDANKVLGARQTQIAVIESYGDIVYDQMRNTLESVAAGEIPAQTAFEKSVNWLRHGVSIAAMGWNLTTSLLQPLGLSQSIVRIGAPWVFKGAMRTLGDAARFESTAKWVHAKSEFMKNRHTTLNREINEIRNQMKGELGVTGNSFFWLIGMGQRVADFPTWVGMYEKQMNEGKDEETAIALADQAVLDSQGGGQVKDLAQIQRGSPLMKLWTNFYSYFNVTYNMTAESFRRTSFKSPTQIAALAVDLLLLYTVPAVLGFIMKEALRGDPPEEDLMKRLAAEQAGYIFGTMAGFREFSSVIQGYFGYEGPAGTRFYSEMSQFMKQVQQGEWDEALWKSINNTAGIVLHYPAGQVQRTVDGYVAWTEDRASPTAILVGPPKEK